MTSLPPNSPSAPNSLKIRHVRQNSIRSHIDALLITARGRRDPITGESQLPLIMWHLVAAVLRMRGRLDHAAIASRPPESAIRIGNAIIHVTNCPEWPLLHQCFAESDQGLRPLVISSLAGAAQTDALAQEVGMGRKIEVLDITQFLVANMLEWTGFDGNQRRTTFEELITRYNAIVEACETDPSLKIEVA